MYSIKVKGDVEGRETIKRAKGIGRSVVQQMGHEAYQMAYHQHNESRVDMTILKSSSHTLRTVTFRKRGLSCWDDKRVWVGANYSVPHGSKDSPVPYFGPEQVSPPRCADVFSDESDVETDVERVVVQSMPVVRNGDSDVEERGEAVGFDDEERSVDESENEEDRMFIDDASEDEYVRPLRRRASVDEVFDIGALAKRVRLG